ncbi:hypothetical protein [Nocardiopsis prasina]|uniref:hypothetical protein n=1 Tax=Nocardiopsis prasina TaxID=2015 RepID=UPI00034C98DA|nr:hypothetical protein [Nocardiopsis prasina]
MRVTDVFAGTDERIDEHLWSQFEAEPVARVDSGRRGGDLVVEVELAPGVDPRRVRVRHEGDTLVLVRSADRAPLYRVVLDAPVGRASLRRTPRGLTVTAPLAGPAPTAVRPGLSPRLARTSRLRTALAGFAARLRAAFTR